MVISQFNEAAVSLCFILEEYGRRKVCFKHENKTFIFIFFVQSVYFEHSVFELCLISLLINLTTLSLKAYSYCTYSNKHVLMSLFLFDHKYD